MCFEGEKQNRFIAIKDLMYISFGLSKLFVVEMHIWLKNFCTVNVIMSGLCSFMSNSIFSIHLFQIYILYM